MAEESGRLTVLAVAGVLAAALLLGGCGPSPAETPPGPAEGTIAPAPDATGGANATGTEGGAHAGGVSATTYAEVVSAIDAAGISIAGESGLRMTTADSRNITVEGGGMSRGGSAVQIVRLELRDGRWEVTETR